jgi:hypothetical protein
MYSYKELAELAGYTSRVADLFDTMDEVKEGKYQKKLVSSADVEDNAKSRLHMSAALTGSAVWTRQDYRVGRDTLR